MKTIIEDLLVHHDGGKEQELPEKTTIRFEIGNTCLSCIATKQGLRIDKINNTMEGDEIYVTPQSSNVIIVK